MPEISKRNFIALIRCSNNECCGIIYYGNPFNASGEQNVEPITCGRYATMRISKHAQAASSDYRFVRFTRDVPGWRKLCYGDDQVSP